MVGEQLLLMAKEGDNNKLQYIIFKNDDLDDIWWWLDTIRLGVNTRGLLDELWMKNVCRYVVQVLLQAIKPFSLNYHIDITYN